MNEPTWIAERVKKYPSRLPIQMDSGSLPAEANLYEPDAFSDYEDRNGLPYLVNHLGIQAQFSIDPQVQVQVRSIEDFIKNTIESQEMRDSIVSYEVILGRLLSTYKESLEMVVRGGRGTEILDYLFREIALQINMSSKSYLKLMEKKIKQQMVEKLKGQMRKILATI